jgi:hypothetical protein
MKSDANKKAHVVHFSSGSFSIFWTLDYEGQKLRSECIESTLEKFAMMPKSQNYPSIFASCIIEIWAHPSPFCLVRHWAHFHRSFKIAPIAMMEILGLDPYQSQTQYLEGKFRVTEEWKQSGYAVAASLLLCIRFVSTSDHFAETSGYKAETLLPLRCQHLITYHQQGH